MRFEVRMPRLGRLGSGASMNVDSVDVIGSKLWWD
jgi:hypothetical protein